MTSPNGDSAGAPASSSSSVRMKRLVTSRPGPPCSTGQWGATQPLRWRILCHSMISWCSKWPSISAVARRRGGIASRRNARTSSRNARCSGVKVMSMAFQ